MSYSANYHFIINPYEISDDDKGIIDEGVKLQLAWEDKHYKPFRDRIRKYLRVQQNKRCGFCRLRINKSQFYPHLEHLVSKTKYKQFTFTSNNLVYSCQKCNFGKGVINVLSVPHSDPESQTYPMTSDGFTIVNPYYDNILDHIEFIGEVIAKPINSSLKGINTIQFYKLDRLDLTEDRAFEADLSQADIEEKLMQRILIENDQALITEIQDFINSLPDLEI
ncbi:hypothetical protein [uncultured Pontibacter sp.]|uniref:hypothetical protein n=1 Tax=uncultured Pontibacter sp. TaxID=453356 RepID=UPI0026204B62|nr:hypothetical protein [uncultured Pontibacter sp.]